MVAISDGAHEFGIQIPTCDTPFVLVRIMQEKTENYNIFTKIRPPEEGFYIYNPLFFAMM